MSREFNQIRTVELTTEQLIMGVAMVDSASIETREYIKKLENKEIPVHPGELENAKENLDKATQLRNAFCVALADIRDNWGKKDEPSKD